MEKVLNEEITTCDNKYCQALAPKNNKILIATSEYIFCDGCLLILYKGMKNKWRK